MVTLHSVENNSSPGKYLESLCKEAAELNLGKSSLSPSRKSLQVPRPKYFHWNKSDSKCRSPRRQSSQDSVFRLRSSGLTPRKLDFGGNKKRSEVKAKNSSENNKEGEESGRLRCEICDIQASSISRLERHMRLHQTLEQSSSPFRCLQCKKSFNQLAKLMIHKYSHAKLKQSGVCNLCRARFRDIARHHRQVHILSSHSEESQQEIFI